MGFFQNIFEKKQKIDPLIDFSGLAVDFHSHVIPGIDDGSNALEISLAMMRGMEELGYSKMITTPHIMADFYKNTPEIILSGLEKVQEAATAAGLNIRIEAAAEYNIDDGFEKLMKAGNLLTFGQKHILVELSTYAPHPNLHTILFNLQLDGFKVILAHAERYSYWHDDMKGYEELRDRDVLFQVNLTSFITHKKPQSRKMAEKLASLDMIDFLGTDMHTPEALPVYRMCLADKWVVQLVRSGRLMNKTLL